MSAADTACAVAAGHDRVHRYVAGTLNPGELDGFEQHLLGCAECQAMVREGHAIRAALEPAGTARGAAAPRRVLWLAALPAAAALVALYVATRGESGLTSLARVDVAPAFAGLAVRDGSDTTTAFADSGMAAYAAGRYREAARLLGVAPGGSPALRFYHGVALLRSRQPRLAVDALAEAADDDAYSADARLYRAKAWLALGRTDSALVDLDRASAGGGATGAHAIALADSVRAVTRP